MMNLKYFHCVLFFIAGFAAATNLDAIYLFNRPAQTADSEVEFENVSFLKAHSRALLGYISGPAQIESIRLSRPMADSVFSRGLVLEIWFDDAVVPAVHSPLADFFFDGCNGRGTDVDSVYVKSNSEFYECLWLMPFKTKARIILRNDTWKDYPGFETRILYQRLDQWNDDSGYFHATYNRKASFISLLSDEMMFQVVGKGHLVGRQYSVVTSEEMYQDYGFVMEGNNEVDIDGQSRPIDYLGSEDSFTFSWGFNDVYIGRRAGMTLVDVAGTTERLSIYRLFDHWPIYFNSQLSWHINWNNEPYAMHGGWVDYATVHYWYQDQPGGYEHAFLKPVVDRRLDVTSADMRQAESFLSGHWKFDDTASNSIALDSTGNEYNGQMQNVMINHAGVLNKSVYFPGTGGSIINIPDEVVKFSPMTLGGWIKPDAVNGGSGKQILAAQRNDSGEANHKCYFEFRLLNDTLELYLSEDGNKPYLVKRAPYPMSAGVWTHVAFTIESSGAVKMYINAIEVDGSEDLFQEEHFPVLPVIDQGLTFGNNSNGDSSSAFRGGFDDWAIWSIALAPAQIQDVMDNGAGISVYRCSTPSLMDLNSDCSVDMLDLFLFSDRWLRN